MIDGCIIGQFMLSCEVLSVKYCLKIYKQKTAVLFLNADQFFIENFTTLAKRELQERLKNRKIGFIDYKKTVG